MRPKPPDADYQATVYWLSDETCLDPNDSGYVGVTANFRARIQQHKEHRGSAARDLPRTFSVRVLFEGPIQKCLELERMLRPRPEIGWNRMAGGVQVRIGRRHTAKTKCKISQAVKDTGAGKGLPKSIEHREAIRQAQLRAIAENPEQYAVKFVKMQAARALNDHTGINSGPKSEAHKQKIRLTLSKATCKYGHIKPFGKPCQECRRARKQRYLARKRQSQLP
jgi:predicted GIY-YIG superfamily endonuclease